MQYTCIYIYIYSDFLAGIKDSAGSYTDLSYSHPKNIQNIFQNLGCFLKGRELLEEIPGFPSKSRGENGAGGALPHQAGRSRVGFAWLKNPRDMQVVLLENTGKTSIMWNITIAMPFAPSPSYHQRF